MLVFHTALHAEARALITHYQLKRLHDVTAFAVFSNEDIFLIESGIGKVNTATAIGWIAHHLRENALSFLNIGIAGHAHFQIGTGVIANRIEDESTGIRYYPPQIIKTTLATASLLTVAKPTIEYPKRSMVDMEASAFIQASSRFAPIELCQSVKVISDNEQHPPSRMKDSQVEELIQPHLSSINSIKDSLKSFADEIFQDTQSLIKPFTEQWRFTQYQKQQLARLLHRYEALYDKPFHVDELDHTVNSSKAIVQQLETMIQQASVQF